MDFLTQFISEKELVQIQDFFFKFGSKTQNILVLCLLILTWLEHYFFDHKWETLFSIKKLAILEENRRSRDGKKKKKPKKSTPQILDLDLSPKINTYAILKFYGMVLMIIDHLGWCYVISDPIVNNYTRAIGRGSAPIFFFLMGFSGSYKFRWVTWRWACYIFISEAIYNLHLVESTWESMSTFLFGNLVLKYAAVYFVGHKWLTCIVWILCYYGNEFINETLHIPYGGFAFQLMICGCFMASGERKFGNFLIIATMGWKMYYTFFIKRSSHTAQYYPFVATFFLFTNTLIFCQFQFYYVKLRWKTLENLIDLATKNAYLIYHGHMIYFYVVVRSWYISGYNN